MAYHMAYHAGGGLWWPSGLLLLDVIDYRLRSASPGEIWGMHITPTTKHSELRYKVTGDFLTAIVNKYSKLKKLI